MNPASSLHVIFKNIQDSSVGAFMGDRPIRLGGAPRGTLANIEGRNGSLWLADGGSDPVTFQVVFYVPAAANQTAALDWLSGAGPLIFADDPLYYWEARVVTEISRRHPLKRLEGTELTATFTCQPFKRLVSEEELTFTEGDTFAGQGSVECRPIITVYGSGDINLMVNDATVAFEDIDEYITLDCDAMIALKDGVNVSPQVSLLSDEYQTEWPTLLPAGGTNLINWELIDGTVTSVVVQPGWRFR